MYSELSKKPFFIIGPCVIEELGLIEEIAAEVVRLKNKYPQATFVFKASYDKANRTALSSFRGPGIKEGLKQLAHIKSKYGIAVTSDIHESGQAEEAGEVAGKIKKMMRDSIPLAEQKEKIEAEMGDVLWYLANLAHDCGISLSTVAKKNLDKVKDRQQRGQLHGEGDVR